jgi:hypothetical protein
LVFSRYIDKLPADDAIFALLRERFQEAQLTCPVEREPVTEPRYAKAFQWLSG